MNLVNIADKTVEIARKAGAAIMEIYDNAADFQVENKADNSPLTLADRASNHVICDGLENLDKKFPVISEENKEIPFSERKNFEYCWLVDPLDGTKEFIKRNGEFTVNIALLHFGKPVLGVVFAPALGELYWGVKGAGAYFQKNGKAEKLATARFKMSDAQLNLVCSRSHLNAETETFVQQFKSPNLVSRGSSLKLLLLAKGEAHVYPRIAPTMEWDIAAGQIILEEAGGKVLDFDRGTALVYNKENLLNPYFVAYGDVVN